MRKNKNKIRIYIELFLDRLGLFKVFQKLFIRIKGNSYPNNFNLNSSKVFELVVKNINENNVLVWPTFGTLLGLVRDKKLLDYDNDLDFGCFFDSDSQKVIRENLFGLGFKRVFSGYIDDNCVLDKFMYDGIEIDFYYFFKDNDDVFSYDFIQDSFVAVEDLIDIGWKIIPYKNVYSKFNFKLMELDNISFNIPNPINTHLEDLYGEDYKIPDKNWHNNKRKNRYPIFNAKVNFKHL